MREIALNGQKRTDTGKKASKLLRKEGLVPCNLYGEKKGENGLPEALAFSIPMAELRKAIYTPHVYVMNITIDGALHVAIVKELQFHPTTDALLHADFYEVTESKPITVGIPVKLNGLAQGVSDGGRINLSIRKINVTAPYKN
ncbi:MAG: 50S ribosomal protein L25, partial [Prevotella sp.]|nr:50S ribosomal protein L25 [Prevotella sp.]